MALSPQDIATDAYLFFKKTKKVGRVVSAVANEHDPLYPSTVLVELPSGRRVTLKWYVLSDLARPMTALEVLAMLGNDPEAA